MRRSIQMMTHTSIILAGGLKRQSPSAEEGAEEEEEEEVGAIETNGSDTNNNNNSSLDEEWNTPSHHHNNSNKRQHQKSFKERIQNKLAFTFQHPYSMTANQSDDRDAITYSGVAESNADVTDEDYDDVTRMQLGGVSDIEMRRRFSSNANSNSSLTTTADHHVIHRDVIDHRMGVGSDEESINAHPPPAYQQLNDSSSKTRLLNNGNVTMNMGGRALPEINIDSPPVSSKDVIYGSRPSSGGGYVGYFDNPPSATTTVGNKIMKANKGEAVWFIENHEQNNKESSI